MGLAAAALLETQRFYPLLEDPNMAEYYRPPFNTHSADKEKRGSLWLFAADASMHLISTAAVLALAIIFVGRFVSPEHIWYFSLLGLVAPIIYVAALLSMLYWIIRWKWVPATITGFFVVLGLFYVPLYYKFDVTKQYGEPKYDRNNIKVLTFNVRYFADDRGRSTVDSVARLVLELNPDIVCLQEYSQDNNKRERFKELLKGYNAGSSKLENKTLGMECFSKYRIQSAYIIEDIGGTGTGVSTDVIVNEDTVRIYNIHLQTTSVNTKDKDYISHGQFISDSTRETRFINIAHGLRRNNGMRAQQAKTIHADIARSPYSIILCGDFNDVPISYAYHTIAKGLDDTFSRQGHLYAHTYRGFFDALRIDYILASPYFETVSYEVIESGDISDHYPVLARLKQTQK